MIKQSFFFCPKCGKAYGEVSQVHLKCHACGYIFFQNQRVTIAGVIVKDDKILLVRRRDDPHKDMLDIPGGYVEPTEHPSQATIREMKEELGVDANIVRLLGVYGPDPYVFGGVTGYNMCVHYLVDIGTQVPIASDDALSIEWFPLVGLPLNANIAFPSHQQFFKDLQEKKISL